PAMFCLLFQAPTKMANLQSAAPRLKTEHANRSSVRFPPPLGAAVYDFCVPLLSSRNARPDRIVISGFGCLTPLGNSREELWDGFRNSRSGIRRIEAFDCRDFAVQIAGEVRGIDPFEFFPLKDRQHVSRTAGLAIGAARQALED